MAKFAREAQVWDYDRLRTGTDARGTLVTSPDGTIVARWRTSVSRAGRVYGILEVSPALGVVVHQDSATEYAPANSGGYDKRAHILALCVGAILGTYEHPAVRRAGAGSRDVWDTLANALGYSALQCHIYGI